MLITDWVGNEKDIRMLNNFEKVLLIVVFILYIPFKGVKYVLLTIRSR